MSDLNYKELQEKGVFDVPYRAFQFMQQQQSKIEQLENKLTNIEIWVVEEKHHIPMSEWHGHTTEEYVDADDLLDMLRCTNANE